MAALTHAQARAFVQSAADQRLSATDTRDLQDHLRGCRECREYSDALAEVADALPRAWRERWGASPNPSAALLSTVLHGWQPRPRARAAGFGLGLNRLGLVAGLLALFVVTGAAAMSIQSQPGGFSTLFGAAVEATATHVPEASATPTTGCHEGCSDHTPEASATTCHEACGDHTPEASATTCHEACGDHTPEASPTQCEHECASPEASATHQAEASATPSNTHAPEPTRTPSPTHAPEATATGTPHEPTPTNTHAPEPTATNTHSPEPTATNTHAPEPTATNTHSPEPTASPTFCTSC